MLARLRDERLLLFSEQELIDAGLPAGWRRHTNDWLLEEVAKNPLKPIHTPKMPDEVKSYLDWVTMYARESAAHQRRLQKLVQQEKKLRAKDAARGMFDPPLSSDEREVLRLADFHRNMIRSYHDSGSEKLEALPGEQLMWLGEIPPTSVWACDLPREAPYPFNQWAPALPPHKIRQITMFEWAVQACEDKFGPEGCQPGP